MNLVQDAMSASNPGTAKQFLGSVQPRPIGQMVIYVGILGLLGVIGTVIGLSVIGVTYGYGPFSVAVKVPLQWALVQAIIGWIGTIIAVVGAGMVIAALSQGMVGRQVSNEEAVTLAGLAASPVLIAGILNIIPGLGWIFVLLAALYSAYLIYLGSGARFGADKAVVVTILFIVAYLVIGFLFALIAGAVMWGLWNPLASSSVPSAPSIPSGWGYYS